jgi:hypothetical protein
MHLELPTLVRLLGTGGGGGGGGGDSMLDTAGSSGTDGLSFGTVLATFDVLSAGLVSRDPAVVTGTLRLLAAAARALGRGLHSSASQLHLSRFRNKSSPCTPPNTP